MRCRRPASRHTHHVPWTLAPHRAWRSATRVATTSSRQEEAAGLRPPTRTGRPAKLGPRFVSGGTISTFLSRRETSGGPPVCQGSISRRASGRSSRRARVTADQAAMALARSAGEGEDAVPWPSLRPGGFATLADAALTLPARESHCASRQPSPPSAQPSFHCRYALVVPRRAPLHLDASSATANGAR